MKTELSQFVSHKAKSTLRGLMPKVSKQLISSFMMALLTLLFIGSAHSQVLLGIRYGYDGVANLQDVRNMEVWQGKKNATLMIFTNFCPMVLSSLFDKQLPQIWNNGNIPLLSWNARACTGSTTPNNIDALIAGGMYDSYLLQFASMLKTFVSGPDGILGTADDRRVYIRLAQEMNGDWFPWSATTHGVAIGAGNTVADYIAMWRRVHSIVESAGLSNTQVQWIFCPNATDSANSHPMEDYYPGDAYVDWVGIDGYNFGGSRWTSPSARFTKPFSRLRALAPGKPLSVPEVGTVANTSSGIDIAAKNQWLLDAFSFFSSNGVKLVSYFNRYPIDDWMVFGIKELGDDTFTINATKYDVFSAYKLAVSSPSYESPDLSNPRLITDPQFLGLSTNVVSAQLTVTPTSGTTPLPVTASAIASSYPGGTVASASIDFGDGTVVEGTSAAHTYRAPGTYVVKARVTNNTGASATSTASVQISAPNLPPIAVLTVAPSTGLGPLTVDATTSGSADPDGSIVATVLNFGDGTIVNNPSAIHTYAKPGEYLATATVIDNQGASAQATATVRLAASPNLPPIAVLTVAPSTGLGPLTVDATTSRSADPDGTIVATVLNFGDGTILNNPSATHTYARPGEYLVTATVIDNQGASAQATATVRLAGRDQEFGERDHERGDCSRIVCK